MTGFHETLTEIMPINISGLSNFPDIFAFGVTILFSLAIAFGAKESSIVNNIFTFLNLAVVLFVIIAGSFKASPSNWSIPAEQVPPPEPSHPGGYGSGGFAPYGLSGILKGAAICFYGIFTLFSIHI